MPSSLQSQMKENETEIQAQKKALDDKAKDIEATRAKFEEDRKRYRILTQSGGKPAAGTDSRPR